MGQQGADAASPGLKLFIVKAMVNENGDLNKRLDAYREFLVSAKHPHEFIEFQGHHAFDLFDDTEESRQMILRTLKFLES